MPRHPQVPPQLTRGPFRSADAFAAGLTRDHLRARAWRRVYRDVFIHRDVALTSDVLLGAARLAVPDGSVAVGATAAWLHGTLIPHPERPVALQFARATVSGAPRSVGVEGSRLALDPEDVVELNGVQVTSPERTCFDLTRVGSTVDGVVAVDAFLSAGLTTKDRLWRYCSERRRWPHVDRLREAVLLGSDRVRSPAESRLRMLLVLDGLPEPLVNAPVHDANGRLLGIPDLLYLKPLLGIEYDGSYHLDSDVHQVDLVRENRFLTNGLPLLRYSARDLGRPRGEVADEVRRALERSD